MAEFVLLDGDMITLLPSFGSATIAPVPGTVTGSGNAMTIGPKVCVEGDEGSVSISGVPYFAGSFVTPGTGTVKITALAADHVSKTLSVGGKKVLRVAPSAQFDAELTVDSKAVDPSSGTPDPTPKYSGGKGFFVGTQIKVKVG